MISRYLSTAAIGVCPDPHSPLNDVSTMNKTMEYMAFGLPVVSFDLPETAVSAGDTALYVPGDDPADLAQAVASLLDDAGLRESLGERARKRAVAVLDWRVQAVEYISVFDKVLGRAPRRVVVLPDEATSDCFRVLAERRTHVRPALDEAALALTRVPAQRPAPAALTTLATADAVVADPVR